jgi:DNA polymerase III delta subunit
MIEAEEEAKVRPRNPGGAYLFHGEETFPAYQFIEDLGGSTHGRSEGEVKVDRFQLGIHSWRDIIDSARAETLLFVSLRVLLVEIPPRQRAHLPSECERISEGQKKLIRDYLEDPSPKAVLVIILPGRKTRSSPLVKFFAALPPGTVRIRETRRVKGPKLSRWVRECFDSQGLSVAPEAVGRLIELVGDDLRGLHNEVEKIATYVGEKSSVEAADIDQISSWVKYYEEYELVNSLERGDYQQGLRVVQNLIKEKGIEIRKPDMEGNYIRISIGKREEAERLWLLLREIQEKLE